MSKLNSGDVLLVVIISLVCTVAIAGFLSITAISFLTKVKITEMVLSGTPPLEAACALEDSYSAQCAVVAATRK